MAFFQTVMGRDFFDRTLPSLVDALKSVSSNLAALRTAIEGACATRCPAAPASLPHARSVSRTVRGDSVYIGSHLHELVHKRVRVCGVFRSGAAASSSRSYADCTAPVELDDPNDIVDDAWAFIMPFEQDGHLQEVVQIVPATDLECFARLGPNATVRDKR